jgi:serine protease Do
MRWLAVLLAFPAWSETLWTERPAAGARGRSPGPRDDFAELARKVAPAVVNVSVRAAPTAGPAPASSPSVGTGFVIRADGLALTGWHVLEGGGAIRVKTADGQELDATVVGADDRTDLALIRIRAPRPLAVLPLGDSDDLRIGEWVMAIGNPLGLEHTVTVGIVSAKGRRELPVDRTLYQDFIQTDASINPGSSGGPLVNARGEAVAVAAAVNREAQGIAFATPINMAKSLLPQLYASGRVRRSWLGIQVQPGDLTPALVRAFRLPRPTGALITEVVAGSPADRAGLRAGDAIFEIDGAPIVRGAELAWRASLGGVGRKTTFKVMRDGAGHQVAIELGAMPDEPSARRAAPPQTPRAAIGMTVSEVADETVRELSLEGRLVVTTVDADGAADRAGVEVGDVVLHLNGRGLRTVDDYFSALRDVPAGGAIRLLVRRAGRSRWVAFDKGS